MFLRYLPMSSRKLEFEMVASDLLVARGYLDVVECVVSTWKDLLS